MGEVTAATHFKKIGLLVLNQDGTKFLVCEPGLLYRDKRVASYLLPGGQMEETSDVACLEAEVAEELGCAVDIRSLSFVNEYTGPAATPGALVTIRLYRGRLLGEPVASTEIGALHWVGAADTVNERVSAIVRQQVIPDLLSRGLLLR